MRTAEDVLFDIEVAEKRLISLRAELSQLISETSTTYLRRNEKLRADVNDLNQRQWPLPAEDYQRYGRQIILPEIGLKGQLRLRNSSVLIIGLGGLGCPAAKYLAGAGVGRIGLLDGDTVEPSNLHRQILHSAARVGMHKVYSAAQSLAETNDSIQVVPYAYHLTPQNALDLFAWYDLILDCTDHPTSRYLISDAAVLSGKPLVSASALKTDGQLIVLNSPPRRFGTERRADQSALPEVSGPCYRCVFPKPPPPETLVSCGEGGILGPVVGTMGILQALEAIRVLTKDGSSSGEVEKPSMLIFSAYNSPKFRTLRMRSRRSDCATCGDDPSITSESLLSGSTDYIAFCGVADPVNILQPEERLTADLVKQRLTEDSTPKLTVIDVRERTQFELASIPGSINIPYSLFESRQIKKGLETDETSILGEQITERISDKSTPLLFVCKFGNDSQLAAKKMIDLGYAGEGKWIGDLKGGLRSWRSDVEPSFPDV